VLTIGGEEVRLIYPGPNHEVGNILVYFPAQKLSVMTDVVMPGWAPYRGWGNADYPPGMLAAHDAILATDFDTYVGGHVYRTGTRADVQQSRDFLLDTIHTTQKAMGSISYADATAGIEPANAWAVVTVWFGGQQAASPAGFPLPSSLTGREVEILRLIAAGLTNTEIAERLFISPLTCKSHVSRILTKLDARDRTQLVVLAYESGLIVPGQTDGLPGVPTQGS
jgi:DNA-binding NarL/FixJ family response regulator